MQGGWSNLLTFSAGPRQCIGYRLGGFLFIFFFCYSSFIRWLTSLHTAILENKCIVATIIRNFVLHNDNVIIENKHSSTLQPRVLGREKEGSQLPLRVTLFEN
jgi:hypothetical protein